MVGEQIGIRVGFSAGMNIAACILLQQELPEETIITTVLPDSGYLEVPKNGTEKLEANLAIKRLRPDQLRLLDFLPL